MKLATNVSRPTNIVLRRFRFLMKIARHPQLSRDQSFIEFLQVEGELPKVSGVSILSGAGIAKLIGKVGDSINKMTYTLPESDQVRESFS